MTFIFSLALQVSTKVTLSARVTSRTGPSSYTSSPLPKFSTLLAFCPRGQDGGRSSKATTSHDGLPTVKDKQTFLPYTYCDNTTHASEKCWKEFGKHKWAQAIFSSTILSPTPPSISMPLVIPFIKMTFTPAEYNAWK